MAHLSQIFSHRCLNHVFFAYFPLPVLTREPILPPLRFGIACLASACSRGDLEEAQNLFSAGSRIWPVMVEVDNGLARSVEMLLAVRLFILNFSSCTLLMCVIFFLKRLFCSYPTVC
jgi:hypothetical protein